MVDIGASHRFISKEVTNKLGLRVEKSKYCLKIINFKETLKSGLINERFTLGVGDSKGNPCESNTFQQLETERH